MVELVDPIGHLHLVRGRVRGRVMARDRVPIGHLHLQLPLVEPPPRVSTPLPRVSTPLRHCLEAGDAGQAGQVEEVGVVVSQAKVELER